MNNLNSFCVIVREGGKTVFWSKPRIADEATKLFIEKAEKYFPAKPYIHGFAMGNSCLCSNKQIAHFIKSFGEGTEQTNRVCRSISSEVKIGNIEIKLGHSQIL